MSNAPSGAPFFDAVRPLFGGHLSQSQVDGMGVIIEGFRVYGDGSAEKLAYVLATAFHETGKTMRPVKETQYGEEVPDDTVVKARLTKAWKAGKLPWVKRDYWSSGFFGRGYVQLTHEANYARAGRELGIDLVADPDRALEPEIAVRVLIEGMLEGWFTSKKLDDFITSTSVDFTGARKIVNGTDKADEIAGYAKTFLSGIRAAGQARTETAPVQPAPAPEPIVPMAAGEAEPAADPPPREFELDWGKVAAAGVIVVAIIALAGLFF